MNMRIIPIVRFSYQCGDRTKLFEEVDKTLGKIFDIASAKGTYRNWRFNNKPYVYFEIISKSSFKDEDVAREWFESCRIHLRERMPRQDKVFIDKKFDESKNNFENLKFGYTTDFLAEAFGAITG